MKKICFLKLLGKHYVPVRSTQNRQNMANSLVLTAFLLFTTVLFSASFACAATNSANNTEERAHPYIKQDERGSRSFGTSQKMQSGFFTDEQTGDRRLEVIQHAEEQKNADGPTEIYVTPELTTGQNRPNTPIVIPPARK